MGVSSEEGHRPCRHPCQSPASEAGMVSALLLAAALPPGSCPAETPPEKQPRTLTCHPGDMGPWVLCSLELQQSEGWRRPWGGSGRDAGQWMSPLSLWGCSCPLFRPGSCPSDWAHSQNPTETLLLAMCAQPWCCPCPAGLRDQLRGCSNPRVLLADHRQILPAGRTLQSPVP